jgi:membrane protease YdiL (CAAX protease family)
MNEAAAAPDPRGWLRPDLVRSWSEFVVMTALILAIPIWNSTHAALEGSSQVFMQALASDRELVSTTAWESTFLAFFLLYLAWRGWKAADLRIRPGFLTTAQGFGLYLAGEVTIVVTLFSAILVGFELQNQPAGVFFSRLMPHIAPHSIHVSWAAIVVSMVLNAFFEEITCMGYIFSQVAARRGPWVALPVTVFLRAACHTYQDPFHLAGIAALFTLYGAVYWWTRKLWPLIFAHLLLDIVSFSVLKSLWS